MLLEKLEQEGIKKELEALGYNCEEIFGGLKERRTGCTRPIPGRRFPVR